MNPAVETRSPMRAAITATWALLLGFGVLMLGDGLQGTLLAVRASLEHFPIEVTGLIMSVFSVGFLAGSLLAPRIVERVGHIRVFAALASIASAAILVHAVFVNPITWGGLRLISGFCFAGIYVVAESWLNERATNETRGQLLSVYMVITYVGVALGQLMLNLADPLGYGLFILGSVLISIALVPLLLSAGPAPHFGELSPIKLKELFQISPLGVVGAFCEGTATAALFAMGPVYATVIGYSLTQVSFFMTAGVMGCVLLQWPVGRLSDRYDRRLVLTLTTFAAAAVAFTGASAASLSFGEQLALIGLFGGLSLPLYSVCIAHTNDFLEPHEMVGASGGLVLASGIGAVIGPLAIALAMKHYGNEGFFWFLAGIHGALGLFAIYRMIRRPSKPLEEQGPYIPTAARASRIAVAEELSESTARQRRSEQNDT